MSRVEGLPPECSVPFLSASFCAWITVSSTRDFGVRLVNDHRPQIWMSPFFPERAAQQQDPSSKSFRLPFQNIDSNNPIAQWTEQVVAVQ